MLSSSSKAVPQQHGRHMCTMVQSILANPMATGGLTIGAAGVALACARSVGKVVGQAVLRQCMVTAEIDSRDDSYRWLLSWLIQHPQLRETSHFSVSTTLRRFGHTTPETEQSTPEGIDALGVTDGGGGGGGSGSGSGSGAARSAGDGVLLIPAGQRLLWHNGKLLFVSRDKQDDAGNGFASAGREKESLTLRLLFGSQRDIRQIILDARAAYLEKEKSRTAIYFTDEYGNWNRVGSKPLRPLSSVFLGSAGQADALLADCRRFLQSERWYADRGIPYRRGYLLYGPPGTGKTSLVAALAGELRLPIYAASLASGRLSDDTFAESLAAAASRCVLLLEDVDAAFRGRSAEAANSGLTFSGLLNAIDGVAAQEGRLLFLTTNHVERLDPALIRPGRVDVRVPFHLCSSAQLEAYVRHFYGTEAAAAAARSLAAAVPNRTLSVAQLQGALMRAPDSPDEGAKAVLSLLDNARIDAAHHVIDASEEERPLHATADAARGP